MFKHTVHEVKHLVERRETWLAEIDGYDVGVEREPSGTVNVWITPTPRSRLPLPLMRFYPQFAADFEHMAEVLPMLLLTLSKELRSAGLEDLRFETQRMTEERLGLR